jgi:4-aminobutyrate aminotransferase
MIGIELDTHDIAHEVEQAAFRRGLLVLTCGPAAVRLAPPLTVTEAQADVALSILEAAINEATLT